MKGTIGLILVAVIVSLVSLGIITYTFTNSATSIATTAKEVEILKAVDQMEAVKRGLPYLFNYSFSQAIYQLSKNGGFEFSNWEDFGVPSESDGPYWRVYEKTYIPSDYDFYQTAEKLTKRFSEKYFDELEKDVSISFAKEPELNLKSSEDQWHNQWRYQWCTLTIKNGILEHKGSFFRIEDKVNLPLSVDCSMLGLLKMAKGKSVDSDWLKELIDKAITSFPSSVSVGDMCEQDVNPEKWLRENYGDVNEKLKQNISKEVSFLKDLVYGSIEVEVLKTAVKYDSSYTYESSEPNYSECGCKEWGEPVETDYRGESDEDCNSYCEGRGYDNGYLADDGNCTCRNCKIVHNKLKGVVYHYNYKGAVSARINITSYRKHFVYDGQLEIKQPTSIIYVNTSNDYSYRPF